MTLMATYQAEQARVAFETVQQMSDVWPLLDPHDLEASFPRWFRAVTAIVDKKRQDSARLARALYRDLRLEAGILGIHPMPQIGPVVPKQLATSMWVTGPQQIQSSVARGVLIVDAVDTAESTSASSAMRHSLNGGRLTITEAIKADPRAKGYRRVLRSANPCKFCEMLAGRGAVYRSEMTADFTAHDGCHCEAQPLFT